MALDPEMTAARERMRKAIAAGKYPDAESWCRAVLASRDARVPNALRMYAVKTLTVILRQTSNDPLAWARALKEREEAGEVLCYIQQKHWRLALEDETRAREVQKTELAELAGGDDF